MRWPLPGSLPVTLSVCRVCRGTCSYSDIGSFHLSLRAKHLTPIMFLLATVRSEPGCQITSTSRHCLTSWESVTSWERTLHTYLSKYLLHACIVQNTHALHSISYCYGCFVTFCVNIHQGNLLSKCISIQRILHQQLLRLAFCNNSMYI